MRMICRQTGAAIRVRISAARAVHMVNSIISVARRDWAPVRIAKIWPVSLRDHVPDDGEFENARQKVDRAQSPNYSAANDVYGMLAPLVVEGGAKPSPDKHIGSFCRMGLETWSASHSPPTATGLLCRLSSKILASSTLPTRTRMRPDSSSVPGFISMDHSPLCNS